MKDLFFIIRQEIDGMLNIKIKEDGKIKVKTKSFKSKEEAEDFIDTIMYERDANKYLKNHKINLIAFMKSRTLQKLNSNIISKAQYTRICNTIRHIERSELSKISVKKIKDIDIQEKYEQKEINKVEKYLGKMGVVG